MMAPASKTQGRATASCGLVASSIGPLLVAVLANAELGGRGIPGEAAPVPAERQLRGIPDRRGRQRNQPTTYGPDFRDDHHRDRLISIKFGIDAARLPDALAALRHETRGTLQLVHDDEAIRFVATELREYLDGTRTSFDLRVDLSSVTPFQRAVLTECAAIPRGQTATYGELARRVGRPLAFRAVGNAMHTNPIPIVIPCHRVLGANGSLTGFGGGLDVKRRLLELEGVMFG